MTSSSIGRYINAVRMRSPSQSGDGGIPISPEEADEVRILKQITRDYVINNPSLAAQQKGHRRILNNLFDNLFEDSVQAPPNYLPRRLVYLWEVRRPAPRSFCSRLHRELDRGRGGWSSCSIAWAVKWIGSGPYRSIGSIDALPTRAYEP